MRVVSIVVIIVLVASVAYAETFKIESETHPFLIIQEIAQKPALLYFSLGKFFYSTGDLERSLEMFEKAEDIDPEFLHAIHNQGVVHYKLGDPQKAEQSFEQTIEVDDSYLKAHHSLAVLSFETADFNDAVDHFEEVVALDDENPGAHFDLAQSYVARFREDESLGDYDDLEDALFHLNRAKDLEPTFPHVAQNIEVLSSILAAREELLNSNPSN